MTKSELRTAHTALTGIVTAVEAGDLVASSEQAAYLRGALTALDALLG